jgi:hypothetical protein
VAVAEGQHALVAGAADEADEFRGALQDLRRRLAAGAAVAPEVPVGVPRTDLVGRHSLVLAVVELGQERRRLGRWKAGQLRGARSPLPRARVDGVERDAVEAVREAPGLGFAVGDQRQVGAARVLAAAAPLRLAVPGEIDVDGGRAASGP